MSVGARIKQARENKGLTQAELGTLINATGSAITNYERGISHPKEPLLLALMKALDVDANYLFQDVIDLKSDIKLTLAEQQLINNYRKLSPYSKEIVEYIIDKELNRPKEVREECAVYEFVAYYGNSKISAGTGIDLIDNPPTEYVKIACDSGLCNADFVLNVSGDSMLPQFENGDRIAIKQTSSIDIGEIGIFIVDGENYIKKLGKNELISLNTTYKPMQIDDATICIGKVLGKV